MSETGQETFRPLGHHRGFYFYYSYLEGGIVALSAREHGVASLYRLAPHAHWQNAYPSNKDSGFQVSKATAAIMGKCQDRGLFSNGYVRGRGVWVDGEHVVAHAGDRVFVSGKEYLPSQVPGKFFYESGFPLGISVSGSLKPSETAPLGGLFRRLGWKSPNGSIWFLGWIVCSIVSGALPWRPHIWLSGSAQSGKSTLWNVIKHILGENCLAVQSATSEAGIRHYLGHDCLPVIFDEIEREDKGSMSRIAAILTLARQASSDHDGRIIKGTSGGGVNSYEIRSCFCLSSINTTLIQAADKGRFSELELDLNKKLGPAAYKAWAGEVYGLLAPEYLKGLFARVIGQAKAIRHNAEVFSGIIASRMGDKRLGDQYGALLAGYYCLLADGEISEQEAVEFLQDIELQGEKEEADTAGDENSLLEFLLQQTVEVQLEKKRVRYSVAELVLISAGEKMDTDIYRDTATKELGRCGFRVEVETKSLVVSNTALYIRQVLRDTVWGVGWHKALSRIKGAMSPIRTYWFGALKTRVVVVPVPELFEKRD